MTIVETRTQITGGVDTHLQFHVAAAVDANGGVLGVETFAVGRQHYEQLLGWLEKFGPIDKIGVEGTGSYGAGLSRYLHRAGVDVVEVDRPNRQVRHRQGKSGHIDAIAAARAALSGAATGLPKQRDGNVEAIRVLQIARRSAVEERIQILNQMRHICFCADDEIRDRYHALSPRMMIAEAANLRPRKNTDDIVRYTTLMVLRELGQRARNLRQETVRHNAMLRPLIRQTAPELLSLHGVGIDTAAKLLVAAGDNAHRLHSEAAWAHMCGVAPVPASSGKTVRHRLNRGGNRQANAALYTVLLTRMRNHGPTQNYVKRRIAEGKTMGETGRMLRRYIAREIYKVLPIPA